MKDDYFTIPYRRVLTSIRERCEEDDSDKIVLNRDEIRVVERALWEEIYLLLLSLA